METKENPSITLDAYAMVLAGLSAGVGTTRALANADVQPARWVTGSEHWQRAIDDSAADDLCVLVAFDAALLSAKDKYASTIEPIQSDVVAWAAFRRHFVAAVDAVSFLGERSLDLTAYARLERLWAERSLTDAAVAAALLKEMAAPLGACPALRFEPSPLLGKVSESDAPAPPPPLAVRTPHDPLRETTPPALDVPSYLATPEPPSEKSPDTLDVPAEQTAAQSVATPFRPAEEEAPVPLERYAVMLADARFLRMSNTDLAQKHSLSADEVARSFAYWRGRTDANAELRAKVDALLERYKSALARVRGLTPPPMPAVQRDASPDAAVAERERQKSGRRAEDTTAPLGDSVARDFRAALPFQNAGLPLPAHIAAQIPSTKVRPKSGAQGLGSRTIAVDHSAARDGAEAPLPFQRDVEGITLEAYAKMAAELAVRGADRRAVLAAYGVSGDEQYRRVATVWNRLVQEQGLTGKYMRLFTQHHDAVRSSGR